MYTRDPRTCAIFIPTWGSIWGSSGFSRNQNNRGSSGAYVTCMYCGLSVKTNTRKTPYGARRSWTHLFCICFCMCGRQKPLSPMAHDAITRGDIGGLESAAYICGDDFNDQPPVPSRSLFWSARLVVFNDLLFAQFHYLQGEPWSGSNMNVNDSLLFVCGTFDSFSKPLTLQ